MQRETQTASQQYVASLEAQISTLQEAQEGSASAGEATKAVVQGVVQELQSTLAEKSAAVEDVTAQLAAKDAQLASQEKDAQVALAALQSKCDELQGLLAKAKEGKAATEKEMEDILAREAKLQGTLDGKTIRITSLEAELARTKEAQGGDAVIAAREVSAAPVGSCSADTARIAQLESELEKAKEARSGSSTQHAALLSGLETQLVAAKAVANQLEADKEALAAEVTALQARLANLEAAAKAAPAMPTASEEAARVKAERAPRPETTHESRPTRDVSRSTRRDDAEVEVEAVRALAARRGTALAAHVAGARTDASPVDISVSAEVLAARGSAPSWR